MKRVLCFVLVVLMVFSCASAESFFAGLFGKKAPDMDAAKKTAEKAVQVLVDEVLSSDSYSLSGYCSFVEIRNTRVIYINSSISVEENRQKAAEDCFGNLKCVVEFFVFSDYYGNIGYNDPMVFSVSVPVSGNMTCSVTSPFTKFRARTYCADYSGIISCTFDLEGALNATYSINR